MPTGYTQMIINGEVRTPKDFLHLCLRNFGVCVCMKDEGFKVEEDYTPKIMEFYQKDVDYHKERLQSAEERMQKILKMTDEELYQQYVKENSKTKKYNEEALQEAQRINTIFDQFTEKIKNWECSPEYENIKNFALDQLKMSKEDEEYHQQKLDEIGDLSRETFETVKEKYRNGIIDDAKWDIDYHTKEMENAESRMAEVVSFYHFFKQEIEKLK